MPCARQWKKSAEGRPVPHEAASAEMVRHRGCLAVYFIDQPSKGNAPFPIFAKKPSYLP
jgi:hypothetical protein